MQTKTIHFCSENERNIEMRGKLDSDALSQVSEKFLKRVHCPCTAGHSALLGTGLKPRCQFSPSPPKRKSPPFSEIRHKSRRENDSWTIKRNGARGRRSRRKENAPRGFSRETTIAIEGNSEHAKFNWGCFFFEGANALLIRAGEGRKGWKVNTCEHCTDVRSKHAPKPHWQTFTHWLFDCARRLHGKIKSRYEVARIDGWLRGTQRAPRYGFERFREW